MNPFLGPVQQDLLESLARRVRILSLDVVAAGWWPEKQLPAVRRKLRQMQRLGLLELHAINAHPLLPVNRPIACWRPGDDEPDTVSVAQRCCQRWSQPAKPFMVCVASPLAANLMGSTARGLPALEHRDHDLRLASVYVHYRQQAPRLARSWIGEHALPKAGYRIKDPDAFLIDSAGRVRRIVESAGRYSSQQVESFHDHCVQHELPYELW